LRQEIDNAVAVKDIAGLHGTPKPPQQILLRGARECGLRDLHAVINDQLDAGDDFWARGHSWVWLSLVRDCCLDVDYYYASSARRIDGHVFSNE
jgi:hypothetical protein